MRKPLFYTIPVSKDPEDLPAIIAVPLPASTEDKQRAHNAVGRAILRRELPPIASCECLACGDRADFYHHPSYAPQDWLRVVPLCGSCHGLLHAVGRERFVDERMYRLVEYQWQIQHGLYGDWKPTLVADIAAEVQSQIDHLTRYSR